MNICFASDDRYAPYMGIAILSILRNSDKSDRFKFYILDNNISLINKHKIESFKTLYSFDLDWIKMDENLFGRCDTKHPNWTLSIFGRYLIPQVIKEDKVLYLDCDVMVLGSLAPLWEVDLNEYYLAGVRDYNVIQRGNLNVRFGKEIDSNEYVNSGVLLINNKRWREDGLFEKLLDFSEKNASLLLWPDQDAINFICRNQKKIIAERWNVMGYLYKPDLFLSHPNYHKIINERQKVVVRHFHPWKKNMFIPNREEYLKLMSISPWYNLIPQDDPFVIAVIKMICMYLWKHPFCFLLPKFYKRWKHRGYLCLFMDY